MAGFCSSEMVTRPPTATSIGMGICVTAQCFDHTPPRRCAHRALRPRVFVDRGPRVFQMVATTANMLDIFNDVGQTDPQASGAVLIP